MCLHCRRDRGCLLLGRRRADRRCFLFFLGTIPKWRPVLLPWVYWWFSFLCSSFGLLRFAFFIGPAWQWWWTVRYWTFWSWRFLGWCWVRCCFWWSFRCSCQFWRGLFFCGSVRIWGWRGRRRCFSSFIFVFSITIWVFASHSLIFCPAIVWGVWCFLPKWFIAVFSLRMRVGCDAF